MYEPSIADNAALQRNYTKRGETDLLKAGAIFTVAARRLGCCYSNLPRGVVRRKHQRGLALSRPLVMGGECRAPPVYDRQGTRAVTSAERHTTLSVGWSLENVYTRLERVLWPVRPYTARVMCVN